MHFDYDSVIGPDGKQEDVYLASAKPVVDDFLEVGWLAREEGAYIGASFGGVQLLEGSASSPEMAVGSPFRSLRQAL